MKSSSTDLTTKGNGNLVELDVPGFKQNHVRVHIKDDMVFVSAYRATWIKKTNEHKIRSFDLVFGDPRVSTHSVYYSVDNGRLKIWLKDKEEKAAK